MRAERALFSALPSIWLAPFFSKKYMIGPIFLKAPLFWCIPVNSNIFHSEIFFFGEMNLPKNFPFYSKFSMEMKFRLRIGFDLKYAKVGERERERERETHDHHVDRQSIPNSAYALTAFYDLEHNSFAADKMWTFRFLYIMRNVSSNLNDKNEYQRHTTTILETWCVSAVLLSY